MFAERVLQLSRKGMCQRACVSTNRQKRQRAEEVVRTEGFEEEEDMDDEECGEEEWKGDGVVGTTTTLLAALHREVGDGGDGREEVGGGDVRAGEMRIPGGGEKDVGAEVDGGGMRGGEMGSGSGDVGAEEIRETPGTVEFSRHVARHMKSHNGSRFPKPTPVSLELRWLHSCVVQLSYPSDPFVFLRKSRRSIANLQQRARPMQNSGGDVIFAGRTAIYQFECP